MQSNYLLYFTLTLLIILIGYSIYRLILLENVLMHIASLFAFSFLFLLFLFRGNHHTIRNIISPDKCHILSDETEAVVTIDNFKYDTENINEIKLINQNNFNIEQICTFNIFNDKIMTKYNITYD